MQSIKQASKQENKQIKTTHKVLSFFHFIYLQMLLTSYFHCVQDTILGVMDTKTNSISILLSKYSCSSSFLSPFSASSVYPSSLPKETLSDGPSANSWSFHPSELWFTDFASRHDFCSTCA